MARIDDRDIDLMFDLAALRISLRGPAALGTQIGFTRGLAAGLAASILNAGRREWRLIAAGASAGRF
jgi:hypothetical protein